MEKEVYESAARAELLTNCTAAAFYDFSVTLIPFGLTPDETGSLLAQANADILVTEAGAQEVDNLPKSIRDIVPVTKGGSKHMDWDEGMPQGVSATTWDEIASGASREVPPLDKETKPRRLSFFSSTGNGKHELVEFTSEVHPHALSYTLPLLTHIHRISSPV